MNRREFLTTSAAALAVPFMVHAEAMSYAPGLVQKELKAGKTVFLDFKASWCSTCAAQERVIKKLKASNPDYDARIAFIDVDWDQFGKSDLVKSLSIPRRSTLVVLKGEKELGRIVAGTSEVEIKKLMDIALSAAS